MKPIGILYEHPHWFGPLFAELGRQEQLPAEGEAIVRVEILGGELLYAIRILLAPWICRPHPRPLPGHGAPSYQVRSTLFLCPPC